MYYDTKMERHDQTYKIQPNPPCAHDERSTSLLITPELLPREGRGSSRFDQSRELANDFALDQSADLRTLQWPKKKEHHEPMSGRYSLNAGGRWGKGSEVK